MGVSLTVGDNSMLLYLAIAVAVLVIIHLTVRGMASVPTVTARHILTGAVVFLLLVLIITLFRFGQTHIAGLLSGIMFLWPFLKHIRRLIGLQSPPGQTSEVKSDYLHMTLDHDSGEMTGTIIRGEHEGEALDDMPLRILQELYQQWLNDDPDSARLLEGWLDRRYGSDWRDGDEEPMSASSGPMTREEALNILGLEDGASAKEIKAAWKEQMRKNHPDQGGSPYLAKKINEAKSLLLGENK